MDFMKPPLFQSSDLLKAISMDGILALRARVKDVEGERATVPQPCENHEQCKASAHAPTDTGRRGAACRILQGFQAVLQQIRTLADCQPKAMRTHWAQVGEIQRRTAGDRP
jgi:hypothetical protein